MKIFNIKQADMFVKNGAIPISVNTGDRFKVYIEFKEDENFKILLKKWLNREI